MKVLLVNGGFPLDKMGGSELQTYFIGQTLVASGDDVTYLAISTSATVEEETVQGMRVHRFNRTLSRSRRRRLLADLIAAQDFDVCYVRIIGWLDDVVRVARQAGVPVVAHVASDLDLWSRPILRSVLSGRLRKAWNDHMLNRGHDAFSTCEAVVVQTESQGAALAQAGVPNAVLIRNMFPDEAPESVDTPIPVVTFVGSIKSVKRPEMFIRLAENLSGSRARFVIIGEIQDEAYRVALDDALERHENLQYMGPLPLDDAWKYIASSRALVNTSSHEGFSNTFIQAWLAGVPVVTCGVDPDGLIASRGLGFACGTERELADKVRRLLEDDTLRESIGRRAREYASAEHTLLSSGPRFRELFLRVSGDNGCG